MPYFKYSNRTSWLKYTVFWLYVWSTGCSQRHQEHPQNNYTECVRRQQPAFFPDVTFSRRSIVVCGFCIREYHQCKTQLLDALKRHFTILWHNMVSTKSGCRYFCVSEFIAVKKLKDSSNTQSIWCALCCEKELCDRVFTIAVHEADFVSVILFTDSTTFRTNNVILLI